jgi:hypothetical protein
MEGMTVSVVRLNRLFQEQQASPNRFTPEISERPVGGHQSHAVEQGFGRDPTVKGIPVDGWKQARLVDHVPIQAENFNILQPSLCFDP